MMALRARRARRKALRAERIAASNQILPPEGVPLTLPIARTGARLSAQLADVVITSLGAIAVVILLNYIGVAGRNTGAVAALLFFFIRIPYYALTELAWNGQTIGKRLLKLKVVAHDGGRLTPHAIVLRNLTKEAEVFLPGTLLLTAGFLEGWEAWLAMAWIVGCLAVPMRDIYARRLGDIIAGTHVVHLPEPVLLPEVARRSAGAQGPQGGFAFRSDQLDHYGAYELQTLESFLRADRQITHAQIQRQMQTRAKIVARIRSKIGYADPVATSEEEAFLRAFYAAQRKHLENRQLFGDRRADKHHAREDRPKT